MIGNESFDDLSSDYEAPELRPNAFLQQISEGFDNNFDPFEWWNEFDDIIAYWDKAFDVKQIELNKNKSINPNIKYDWLKAYMDIKITKIHEAQEKLEPNSQKMKRVS